MLHFISFSFAVNFECELKNRLKVNPPYLCGRLVYESKMYSKFNRIDADAKDTLTDWIFDEELCFDSPFFLEWIETPMWKLHYK